MSEQCKCHCDDIEICKDLTVAECRNTIGMCRQAIEQLTSRLSAAEGRVARYRTVLQSFQYHSGRTVYDYEDEAKQALTERAETEGTK